MEGVECVKTIAPDAPVTICNIHSIQSVPKVLPLALSCILGSRDVKDVLAEALNWVVAK